MAVSAPVRGRRARLREWLRPPRRLRLKLGGTVLILGVLALGLATLNTGNNLLYLLVGELLGLIALSGWLSEQSITGVRVQRRLPTAVTVGQRARVEYHVRNLKRRLATVSLELAEAGTEPAFVPILDAGESTAVSGWFRPPRRGIYRFTRITLSTSYPFGLFIKERDIEVPGTFVVWPRTDRNVRAIQAGGVRGARLQSGSGAAAGAERGEFRGLRPYRFGDDPRDVHWRSSARLSEPVVREHERDASDTWWLVLDLAPGAGEAAQEAAVEIAAALAARAATRGDRFGFAAGSAHIAPAVGGGQLEAVLDVLAAAEFRPNVPLSLPAAPRECVLVSAAGGGGANFADVVLAAEDPT